MIRWISASESNLIIAGIRKLLFSVYERGEILFKIQLGGVALDERHLKFTGDRNGFLLIQIFKIE